MRGIQYAAAFRGHTGASGILDHPLSRMMTGVSADAAHQKKGDRKAALF
jgi:hypothetical protein